MSKKKLSQNLQDWVDARKRHHLSHAHVQMARVQHAKKAARKEARRLAREERGDRPPGGPQ